MAPPPFLVHLPQKTGRETPQVKGADAAVAKGVAAAIAKLNRLAPGVLRIGGIGQIAKGINGFV
ncbi:MAG: hypothetical protein M5U34_31780 [Chloroflexi bacterium]|nr:hypothetical protein [Chloroflexota bacterium]